MKFIADFHIHSKYSRATSPDMNIETLSKWAKIKGIALMGTGDFTHYMWLDSLKKTLKPLGNGLFEHNDSNSIFILTTEISCIYSKKEKVRKIHILIFAPSFEAVEKINERLSRIGNLDSDGRPILGLDAKELAKIVFNTSEDCFIVPAHIWTPWFSLFGSNSGFDSIEECFEEFSPHIYAVETGLSSDPSMNWRLSDLDNKSIISCSDAHSPSKIGREACVFDTELNYKSITNALKGRQPDKFLYTIEFFPEEGKYHYNGHRNCNITQSPEETKTNGETCPVCGKKITIGVMQRVEELADRSMINHVPPNTQPFKNLIPLEEIIAEALGKRTGTVTVNNGYMKFISTFQNEFNVLLNEPIENLSLVNSKVADGIRNVREGKVKIFPGYDGVYGKISIFEKEEGTAQLGLF